MPLTHFGKELRNYRIYHGLLLADMSYDLNMLTSELSAIETGKKPIPDGFIQKLYATYHIPASVKILFNYAMARDEEEKNA